MNNEQMKQMIDRKNKLLKKGSKQFREINDIARGLEEIDGIGKTSVIQFCKLAGYKLRMLSYTWVDMDEESETSLSEPTEAEIEEVREVTGDD